MKQIRLPLRLPALEVRPIYDPDVGACLTCFGALVTQLATIT
jgi:hypothetical protein